MGIDNHGFNFLRYSQRKQELGNVITIGRQNLNINGPKLLGGIGKAVKDETYCENLLIDFLGAKSVESIDKELFEGANHAQDFNEPLNPILIGKYDTIFDGGSLEHIFDVRQSFKNVSLLCRQGGQILHVLPANNFCGHGFFQFSPELFFSLYSQENGYSETEVFIADLSRNNKWYKVSQPSNGKRIDLASKTSLYVLVRTIVKTSNFENQQVQQSDYIFRWSEEGNHKNNFSKLGLTSKVGFLNLAFTQKISQLLKRYKAVNFIKRLLFEVNTISFRNPNLTPVRVNFLSEGDKY